ncbi:MAG: hypothetical protein AB8G77_05745 [Rhodothermales bacterium]
MPQTVLAFLAMMIVTMLSLNQQHSMVLAYELMLNDEMEFMASAVALRAMEYISQRDFDAAVAGTATVTDPTNLQASPFNVGNDCTLQGAINFCTDIDDFHGMLPDTMVFSGRDGDFKFTVSAEIYYVDDVVNPDSAVSTQTYSKTVAVIAQDVLGIMLQPIRLTRLVACEPGDGCL